MGDGAQARAAAAGQTLSFTIGANPTQTVTFGTGAYPGNVQTLAELTSWLSTNLPPNGGNPSVGTGGNVTIAATSTTDTITVGGTATPLKFGIHTTTALPSNGTVIANDVSTFVNETISGGAFSSSASDSSPNTASARRSTS